MAIILSSTSPEITLYVKNTSKPTLHDTTLHIDKKHLWVGHNWKFQLKNLKVIHQKGVLEVEDADKKKALNCLLDDDEFVEKLKEMVERQNDVEQRKVGKKKNRNVYGKRKKVVLPLERNWTASSSNSFEEEDTMKKPSDSWMEEEEEDVSSPKTTSSIRRRLRSKKQEKIEDSPEPVREEEEVLSPQKRIFDDTDSARRKRLRRKKVDEEVDEEVEEEAPEAVFSSDTNIEEEPPEEPVLSVNNDADKSPEPVASTSSNTPVLTRSVPVTDEEEDLASTSSDSSRRETKTIDSFFQPKSSSPTPHKKLQPIPEHALSSSPKRDSPAKRTLFASFYKSASKQQQHSSSTPSPNKVTFDTNATLIQKPSSPKAQPTPSTPPSHKNGLINLGNTCYLNASLQLLFSLPSLLPTLTQPTPLHQTLLTASRGNPQPFKTYLDTQTKKFFGKEQRDAHEFLTEILDQLESPLFEIQIRNQLVCDTCGYSRTHKELYRHLSLDLLEETLSVEGGLKYFFKEEKRVLKCEKCEDGESATQSLHLDQPPKALLLHLKRFFVDPVLRKNTSRISYPQSLTVFEKQYKLKSSVHHIGSTPYSGHYITDALVKISGKEKWMRFDDDVVTEVDGKEEREAVYLVLYERL